ncbi:MAG: hypothetical protein M3N56_17085 [Actinomycetota bacterium]|nr:hypothetical protein [Actinomycetota bacterium]
MKRLAWCLVVLYVVASAAGAVLLVRVPAEILERQDTSVSLSLAFMPVVLVFALIGAVVASRLPGNPIGWLFLALAQIQALYALAFGYAQYAAGVDPGLPAIDWAAWVATWVTPLTPIVVALAVLLFPDGRLVSPRWRFVVWACVPTTAVVLADYALAPGTLEELPAVDNPLAGPEWLANFEGDALIFALLLTALSSLIVRFRRSHGIERQQVKWIAYAAGLIAAFLTMSGIATVVLGEGDATNSNAAGWVFAGVFSGLPIAAGIAILRHGLYDVDVVIRRTLIYGALTATLAAGYLGCVLLAQLVIGADSSLAVAASTLAMAALFRPARGRIQELVDRRFYRRRYDATHTLEAFGGRLRHELDLEAVGTDLRRVVQETVQPEHVSLWLRRSP